MAKSYEEFVANIPPEIREKAKKQARKYLRQIDRQLERQRIRETLKAIRQASGLGQKELAEALGVKQPTVARMENQGDIKLSTLIDIVKVSGGEMEISVKMQGQKVQFQS